MASSLGAFIELRNHSELQDPQPVVYRDTQGGANAPSAFELDRLRFGEKLNGPAEAPKPIRSRSEYNTTGSASTTPFPAEDLETSRPSSPMLPDHTDVIQTIWHPRMNKYRVISCCTINFANGLYDSAPGALLPYLEKYYSIGYTIVSLIFIANAFGFISAAPPVHFLQARLGRAKFLAAAQLTCMISYLLLVITPPYPVVVISFFLAGYANASALAVDNVFCANLANATGMLGAMHGAYGLGGVCGPLLATAIASRGVLWSRFYAIPLGLAVGNGIFACWAYAHFEWDNRPQDVQSLHGLLDVHPRDHQQPSIAPDATKEISLLDAVRNRTTILGAIFIFAYQGAEVSISGWVISYLLAYRTKTATEHNFEPSPDANPSIGYVTAGFWGGITLGRLLLSHPCNRIGEKRAVFGLTVGAAVLIILVWQIPNVVGPAVSVAIAGLLLGPVYPCATNVFSRLLDKKIQVSSLAFIGALGSSGGAFGPFATGLIAASSGTWVLFPICLGLFALMGATWAALPRLGKKKE